MTRPVPELPPAIPRRGSTTWRWIGRSLMRLTGWGFEGNFPDRAKLVLAVAPHTSNWDFLHGAAARMAKEKGLVTWSVSLSHSHSHAVAVVVAMG